MRFGDQPQKWAARMWTRPVGLFYQQWASRYLLYLVACVLFGVWTFIAFEVYGWMTWRTTSISFRGIHAWHTLINFGLCLYLADEWLARLAGRWGRFENRTLGKQTVIWGLSFVVGFYLQRTLVFEQIQFYALDLYHYYQQFPQMRPRSADHFLFCLPFFMISITLLALMVFVRQRGLEDEQLKRSSVNGRTSIAPFRDAESERAGEKQSPQFLQIQVGSRRTLIDADRISHITVEDHYCRVYTGHEGQLKSHFVKSSLTELLEQLPPSHFMQIHRSHIVNLRSVRRLETKNRAHRIHLDHRTILPVSRYRLAEIVEKLDAQQRNRPSQKGDSATG